MLRESSNQGSPSKKNLQTRLVDVDAVSEPTRFALRIPSLYPDNMQEESEGASFGSAFLQALNAPKMPEVPGQAKCRSHATEEDRKMGKEPSSQDELSRKEVLWAKLIDADAVSGATLTSLCSAGKLNIDEGEADKSK